MKINFKSISFKIIGPILILLIISTVLLANIVTKSVEKHWLANSQETILHDAEMVNLLINREIEAVSAISSQVETLYNSLYITNGTGTVPRVLIKQICDPIITNHNMSYISIYDKDMNLISPAGYNEKGASQELISIALNGSGSNILRLERSLEGLNFEVISARPIVVSGQIIAAVEVVKVLSRRDFMSRFPNSVGCEFAVIKNDVVVHSTMDVMKETKIDQEIYETLDQMQEWDGIVDIDGENYYGHYWPYIRVDGLSLFVGESVEALNEATYEISGVVWFLQGVSSLLVLIMVVLMLLFIIIRPIKATNKAILNLSSGDADLTVRLSAKGNDEIAQLSKGVNKFIELLQQMIKSIFEKSVTVNNVISDLGATAQETASSCTEIMANIESVKNQSMNQTTAVTSTSSIIEESNSYMTKLGDNIVAQTSDITQSSSAVEQMIGNINAVTASANMMSNSFADLTRLISEGSENVKACSEVITDIEGKSKLLAEANDVIKSISKQTNLLAMNAMIESAHAGEAGKGFAVVSEEIRKLAENASTQATRIEENIREIVNLILKGGELSNLSENSFTAIDNQVNIVEPIVRQIAGAMEEQSNGSAQILESLVNMKDESISVDDSSKQLSTEITKINQNMETVSQISQTILCSMDEMAAGSQHISVATQNVSELALSTREAMDGINDLIEKFKV